MEILYLKALHIIFVVSWFAALFYIVRLFIYATDAQSKDDVAKPILTQQLLFMQKKLWYIIGWPAMIGTHIFGWWMFFLNTAYYFSQPWMWLKLIAIILLTLYHLQCQRILSQQKQGVFKYSSFKLRLLNELATLFLVAIVFLVVVKSTSGLAWGVLGLFAFAGVLMLAVYLYRRNQKNKQQT
jgi:protoporphyrinogen IX oxidase